MRCVDIVTGLLFHDGKIVESPLCVLDNGDYLYLKPLVYVDREAKEKRLVGLFPFIFGKPIPLSNTVKVIMPNGKEIVLN